MVVCNHIHTNACVATQFRLSGTKEAKMKVVHCKCTLPVQSVCACCKWVLACVCTCMHEIIDECVETGVLSVLAPIDIIDYI